MRWLENERYQRALWANAQERPIGNKNLQTFLEEEWETQCLLDILSITPETPIKEIPEIDELDFVPEWVQELPHDFIIEVAGMPNAGKDTVINQWLESLWLRGTRGQIHFAGQAAEQLPEEFQHYKTEDPFEFQLLTELKTFTSAFEILVSSASGKVPEVPVLYIRGGIDRVAFRRAQFLDGKVDPSIIDDEWFWEYYVAPPQRIGAVILCLIKPVTAMEREGPREEPGPVMNIDFLHLLYEQYLRLHYELPWRIYHHNLTRGPLPIYIALNMEGTRGECFEKFNRTMFQIFNLVRHKI